MNGKTVLVWIVIALAILYLIRIFMYSKCSSKSQVENMESGSPATSKVAAQNTQAQIDRNQQLHQKCVSMFGGDMKFLNACNSTNGTYLTNERGIEQAYDIYVQNKRDGYEWGSNVYLAIVQGMIDQVICQTVYLDNPQMQGICFNSPDYKKKEMWVDYWNDRRKSSRDWRMLPATLQL